MKYKFPEIRTLDDIRQAIEGRDEFIIAERGPFKIVCYVVAMPDTFPEVRRKVGDVWEEDHNFAIRRECRGMIFCSTTGKILRRPLAKWFNINEKDETQLNKLDFNLSHKVYTKLDGSMIAPFEAGYGTGDIRFGTKMGISEVALQAEKFVELHPSIMEFSKWCIQNRLTPIYEYTSPNNRIVVPYQTEAMTLLAVRHMETGEHFTIDY